MKSFKKFVTETRAKNTHLEHIEDEVFYGKGNTIRALKFLDDIREGLYNKNSNALKSKVSIKWDGSPSIVFGINPENKKFFISTKKALNFNPVIYQSIKQIEEEVWDKNLKEILIESFKELSKLELNGIFQGDLLFLSKDLKTKKINEQKYSRFTPNTITYLVESEIINDKKLGIAVHTKYIGKTLSNLSNSFNIKESDIKQTNKSNVWLAPTTFQCQLLEDRENDLLKNIIQTIKSNIKLIEDQDNLTDLFKLYTNQLVRENKSLKGTKTCVQEFFYFIQDRLVKESEELKTQKGKENKLQKIEEYRKYIRTNQEPIKLIFKLHEMITECKLLLLNKIVGINGVKTFIDEEETPIEGLVISEGTVAVKLINRLEFSRKNFLNNE